VINRVVAPDELAAKGMKFAADLAAGPTIAHGATKQIIRAYLDGGVAAADEVTADLAAPLFDTEDLKRAVQSFLTEGPGKATFEGR
jgi:enoyl-CoA hydratase/carnithine racemase